MRARVALELTSGMSNGSDQQPYRTFGFGVIPADAFGRNVDHKRADQRLRMAAVVSDGGPSSVEDALPSINALVILYTVRPDTGPELAGTLLGTHVAHE